MEGGDQISVGNGGSRWNPTKEQISLLENLYKQGVRTPSAEQIQQITIRLREFGHIEGKNVFYWFQNHKARQRQKQKQEQENLAYFNRFCQYSAPAFPSIPYQNVICRPCCISTPPKNDPIGLIYQQRQFPKVQLPSIGSFKKTQLIQEPFESTRYNKSMHDHNHDQPHQQTLDLFPIHPTGLLSESRNGNFQNLQIDQEQSKNPVFSCNNYYSSTPSCSDQDQDHDQPFFDFFCGN